MSQGSLPELCQGRIGSTLKGKWTLERLLGVGGMAAVYVGLHKIGRRDAIKILHPEVARSREFLARFEQEAKVSNQFQHPGAVEVRDIDVSDEGCPFLVMELLEGESLGERAQRLDGIAEADLLRYVDELLDVLSAAHEKGIVHRDIKLDNLFVLTTGELKVLDFGIARMRSGPAMTRIGVRLGTTAYMPPEQVRGEEVDGRADLFAVGATMFRLIARRRIHEAPTDGEMLEKMSTLPAPPLRQVSPNTDPRLALIVDRALAFRKHERYPDAQTMQADVRALSAGLEPPYASAAASGSIAPASIAMGADRVLSSAFAMEATGVEPSAAALPILPMEPAADPTRVERRVTSQSPPPAPKTQVLSIPRPAPRPAPPPPTARSAPPPATAQNPAPETPRGYASSPPPAVSATPATHGSSPPPAQSAQASSHLQSHRPPEVVHTPSNRPPASHAIGAEPYSAASSSGHPHAVASSLPYASGPESARPRGLPSHPPQAQNFDANPGYGVSQTPLVGGGHALAQTARSAQSFVPPHLATAHSPAHSPPTPASFAMPGAPHPKRSSGAAWVIAVGALLAVAAVVGLYLTFGVTAEPASLAARDDDAEGDEEARSSPRKKKSSEKSKESASAATGAPEEAKAEEPKSPSAKLEETKAPPTATPNLGTPKTMPGTEPVKPADITPTQTATPAVGRPTSTPIGGSGTAAPSSIPGRGKPNRVRL